MPLQEGRSEATIRANIAELVRSGKSVQQAAAIAYRMAGRDTAQKGDKQGRK